MKILLLAKSQARELRAHCYQNCWCVPAQCYNCVVLHPFILGLYVNYNYITVIFIIATFISSHRLACR